MVGWVFLPTNMDKLELYTKLKKAGFPQGGSGQRLLDPNSDKSVYMPTVEELLTQYLADPEQWAEMRDAIAMQWLALHKKREEVV